MVATPYFRAKTIKQDYNEWEECQELKKIDGTWYAIGFYDCKRVVKTYLGDWETTHLILIRKSTAISEVNIAEIIDISTLAIHFPNILDTKGNKIFASLQEDGKGGDILFDMEYEYTLYFDGLKFKLQGLFSQSEYNEFDSWENFDIIGVEEWKH